MWISMGLGMEEGGGGERVLCLRGHRSECHVDEGHRHKHHLERVKVREIPRGGGGGVGGDGVGGHGGGGRGGRGEKG